MRAIAATLLFLVPTAALGQEDPARAEANELFHQANDRFDAGEYEAALDLFRRANARYPSPRILVNVATTLKALGRDAEAAETYDEVLSAPAEAIPASLRREVQSALRALEPRLGRLSITVSPDGAAVSVDGRAVGTSPLAAPVRVLPGTHLVTAEIPGEPVASARVETSAGQTAGVSLRVEPGARAGAPGPATAEPDLRVRPEPEPAGQVETSEPGPIVTQWWFWAGVGAVAVGATVVAIAVASSGPELGTVR